MNKRLKGAVRLARDVSELAGNVSTVLRMDLLLRARATAEEVLHSAEECYPPVNGGEFYCSLRRVAKIAREQIERNKAIATQRKLDRDRKPPCVMPDPSAAPLSS